MCGRLSTADLSATSLTELFDLNETTPFITRYNIAPSLPIPAIREQNKNRSLTSLRWGLIPHWARSLEIALHTFNARIETLTQKPSFRESFKAKRCIIPISGFYEWQKLEQKKQPFYIHRLDGKPLTLAGLWDQWLEPATKICIESCTIVTMPAAGSMQKIHHRMPAIIEPEHFDVWLDPEFQQTHVLQDILKSGEHEMEIYAVSGFVGNARHDGDQCVQRLS